MQFKHFETLFKIYHANLVAFIGNYLSILLFLLLNEIRCILKYKCLTIIYFGGGFMAVTCIKYLHLSRFQLQRS